MPGSVSPGVEITTIRSWGQTSTLTHGEVWSKVRRNEPMCGKKPKCRTEGDGSGHTWGHDSNCSWRPHGIPGSLTVWMFNSFLFPTAQTFLCFAYARSNKIFLLLATNAAVNLISLISTSLNFKSKWGENTLALIST